VDECYVCLGGSEGTIEIGRGGRRRLEKGEVAMRRDGHQSRLSTTAVRIAMGYRRCPEDATDPIGFQEGRQKRLAESRRRGMVEQGKKETEGNP
jgi:hypothetical protein